MVRTATMGDESRYKGSLARILTDLFGELPDARSAGWVQARAKCLGTAGAITPSITKYA